VQTQILNKTIPRITPIRNKSLTREINLQHLLLRRLRWILILYSRQTMPLKADNAQLSRAIPCKIRSLIKEEGSGLAANFWESSSSNLAFSNSTLADCIAGATLVSLIILRSSNSWREGRLSKNFSNFS
jgi:hypothetical protein